MYTLQASAQEPLDQRWYDRLGPLVRDMGETFMVLMPPPERLDTDYQRFLASEHEITPDLYPDIQGVARLENIRSRLVDLSQDIETHEEPPAVIQAYTGRISEMVLQVDMMLAAGRKDDADYQRINRAIYGQPDKDIFAASCAWLQQEARLTRDAQPHMRTICDGMLAQVPDVGGDASSLFPDEATFEKVRQLHLAAGDYGEQLFGGIALNMANVITPRVGDPITRQAIAHVGSDFDLADAPSGLWSVLQSKRSVIRPPDYALSPPAFYGIVAHEVGSHLLESTNGAKSRLKLLELGLDHYEAGNEGRAVLREQIMFESMYGYIQQPGWYPTKASWEYRVAIHLIISLATGINGKEYSFKQIFELLEVLFRFWTVKRGQRVDDDTIRRGAWSMAVRALKGTSGHGGAYLKDIVYLEGNIRCWQVARNWPELILHGDLGKFDIANDKHVMILNELGILPKNNR